MSVDIVKHDNGFYYIHYTEGRRSKRVSTRAKDIATAEVFRATWTLAKQRVISDDGAEFTISDLWSVYHKRHVEKNVSSTATLDYAWKNLEPHFGALSVAQVGQDAVDDYVAKRTSGRLGRAAKLPTCRRELGALYACLRFCSAPESRQRLFNPALLEPVDLPSAGEPRDRWLTMDELQRLYDAASAMRRGDRLSRGERFLWLALETGARKQAILDLTWDRVDFETNVVHYDVPGRQKTKKGRASVPISKALRPVLDRAWQEREGDLVLDNKASIWSTIQFVAIRAGIGPAQRVASSQKPKATGVSPHVLRHTAATNMARRGVPLWIIAKILGNTLAMVEKVYAKHCPDHLRAGVDMISRGELEAAE